MKRIGNLFETICSIENLMLADKLARRGKLNSYGVKLHDRNREQNIQDLRRSLLEKTYHTSRYDNFMLSCDNGKLREISRLPYYPDRITHHAIMNIIEPILVSTFTADTYSCIKGRGIHSAADKIKTCLKSDVQGTKYCLKLDIKKFYPNIDHSILKAKLRKKFKDNDLLWLLDEIIDSAPGVPIGNYLSQSFANLYLTYFDHWMKEELKVKYYFRYCDDMIILSGDKAELHALRLKVDQYMRENLNLVVKGNWQVFPVDARSLDFVGYRFYHTHTLLRKSIKKAFARKMAQLHGQPLLKSYAAYLGWAKHCNSYHLIQKLTNEEVLRLRDKIGSGNEREQNNNCTNTQQGDNRVELQDRGQQVPQKQEWKMLVLTNRS